MFHAPAKINLALHVTGRRGDGYHLLDTLVAFAETGDKITVTAADEDRFTIGGPYSAGLEHGDGNLVIKARDLLRAERSGAGDPVHLHLDKQLPLASGIGGGSADAAATLKALDAHWNAGLSDTRLRRIGGQLGADVPMCLAGVPLAARGIGEEIAPLARFPRVACLLVNCGAGLSTPQVFAALQSRDNPPMAGIDGGFDTPDALFDWLAGQRNDLQAAALTLEPRIAETLDLLHETGARIVRMSGSGATCFALYDDDAAARRAGEALTSARPGWYVQATHLEGSHGRT